MKRIAISALLSLSGFALFATAPATAPAYDYSTAAIAPAELQAIDFLLDAPGEDDLGREMNLWATYYHMPTVAAAQPLVEKAASFMGRDGKPISLPISERDWCYAALQGSVRVVGPDGESQNFVFVDSKGPEQINCDGALGNLRGAVKSATRRARFAPFEHPAGCDVRPDPLIPYRTIAVDRRRIKRGSVLYIPDLRGQIFYQDGLPYAHDGYVIATDTGGAIKGNHIDVFVDDIETKPFPSLIASHPSKTFKAFIVDRGHEAVKALRQGDERICHEPDYDAPSADLI